MAPAGQVARQRQEEKMEGRLAVRQSERAPMAQVQTSQSKKRSRAKRAWTSSLGMLLKPLATVPKEVTPLSSACGLKIPIRYHCICFRLVLCA